MGTCKMVRTNSTLHILLLSLVALAAAVNFPDNFDDYLDATEKIETVTPWVYSTKIPPEHPSPNSGPDENGNYESKCRDCTSGFKKTTRSNPVSLANSIEETQGSNPNNFANSMGLYADMENNNMKLAELFVDTPLVTRYSMMQSDNFIQDGNEDLFNVIEKSFDTAFEKSALATFGKSMNTIRPHIAYAIAISWNVQHYNIDIERIYKKAANVNNLTATSLRDDGPSTLDSKKVIGSLGSFLKNGEISKVSDNLRDVEKNFEDFVIDVQIWSIQSQGQIYEAVKNVQKAMKRGDRALLYQAVTNKIPKTRAQF